MKLNGSTFPEELQSSTNCRIYAIEPINQTLIVLLMKNYVTKKRAILLACFHASSSLTPNVASSRIQAEVDEASRNSNQRAETFDYKLSYSILDGRTIAASIDAFDDKLTTRDTLDSIVQQTTTQLEFNDVVDDKLVFRYTIARENVNGYFKGNCEEYMLTLSL